ncbi:MAG: hypothetical protein WCB18_08165 [Thermoplasmata archaeon]
MVASPEPSPPPLPWLFFIVAIVAAVVVGVIIAYLGLTGHLGAGIPGSKSPGGGIVFAPILGLVSGAWSWAARRNPR